MPKRNGSKLSKGADGARGDNFHNRSTKESRMQNLIQAVLLAAVISLLPLSSTDAGLSCPDEIGDCWAVPNCPNATCGPDNKGPMSYGTCISWTGCKPCHSQDTYRRMCSQKYSGKIVGCNCEDWYFSFRDDTGKEIDN